MSQGICLTIDPDLWHPDGEGRGSDKQIAKAKEVCLGCPVRRKCAVFAVCNPTLTGVWGGTTFIEREHFRRRLTKSARPARASKKCIGCGKKKTLDQFTTRTRARDGLTSKCISCNSDYRRELRERQEAAVSA